MKEHSYLFGRHYLGERLVYDHFVKPPGDDPERGVIRLARRRDGDRLRSQRPAV
jgi:hypothetical protein